MFSEYPHPRRKLELAVEPSLHTRSFSGPGARVPAGAVEAKLLRETRFLLLGLVRLLLCFILCPLYKSRIQNPMEMQNGGGSPQLGVMWRRS